MKLFFVELHFGLGTLHFTKLSLQIGEEAIGLCGKQLCSSVKLQKFSYFTR